MGEGEKGRPISSSLGSMAPIDICLTKRRSSGFQAALGAQRGLLALQGCTLTHRAGASVRSCADLLAWYTTNGVLPPPRLSLARNSNQH